MIEKVNRQFQLLAAERKKFDQIIKTISINESLFKSYVTAIQSVSMTACNITESFTEVLSYSQIKMLSKSVSQVVSELVSKLEQYNSTIRKMRSQKEQQGKKIKSQYCSICMQNIHENNIKQAKMYLEQEAKQNFHKAVQQVQRMANQPLFTNQQNNAYDEKLYLHLAQKQKVLNTNCRRMQEFVDIVNATLDDLSKLKDISIEQEIQGNVQYMSNFAPATKLGEQVSKFLKKSFSQKVPPWINKMLTRIMQWYLHEKSQKLTQKSIQTDNYESAQSKQLKQVIKQLQKTSKQKQELNEQLKILKTCNKKLEQINMENINIIANLNRLIKTKQNSNNNSNSNFRETFRNGKNSSNSLTKSGIKFMSKDVTPVSEEVQSSYVNAVEEQVYTISKKKKTQINNALPQIKRNKVGTMRNLGRDLDYSNQALNCLNETEKDIKHGRNYEQAGKSMRKSHKHIEHRQLSPASKKIQKDKNNQAQKEQQQNKKQKIGQKSGKIPGEWPYGQEAQDKKREKQKKVMRSSIQLKKEIKSNMGMLRENGQMKKSKQDVKLMKAGINRISNVNQYGPYTSKSRDQSYAHLEQFVANSKMSEIKKKSQQYSELHNKIQQRPKQSNKTTKSNNNEAKQINMNAGQQNNLNINQIGEQYCNQSIYTNELAVMKRVSKDLSNQILSKKISLYNKIISNDADNGNFHKNKEFSVEALNKYQIMNARTQEPIKAVRQNYSLIQKLDTNNRNSSYERKQENKQSEQKIRNSQSKNSYGCYKQRIKVPSKYSKMPEYGEQSLCSSWNESEQNQRRLFQILKNNKALNEHLNYEDFTSLFLTVQKQQKQPIDSSTSSALKSPISKYYLHSRKPSQPHQPCASPRVQQKQRLKQKERYIQLFISKSQAYKYEQTMKKSYHRNKIRQLSQEEHEYCYEMFCNLIQCKKIQKQVYQQFCSILRYPFQTLYNQFDVLNFITDITFDTFQYYFRKIVWLHRKCGSDGVVCQHVAVVGRELESIVKLCSQSPV